VFDFLRSFCYIAPFSIMRFDSFPLLLLAGMAVAMPQVPTSAPKSTGAPKSGVPPKSGGGLGSLFGGGGGSGGLGALASLMGLDPNAEITSMVCESFSGTNKMGGIIGSAFGSPNGQGPDEQCMVDRSGGSGKYKAHFLDDPSLANHTIYVPENPPPGKLPVIIWGNGFCMAAGTMFANFLNEIASHGFMIVANGPAKGAQLSGQTTYKDLIKAIDWVTTSPEAKKYGDIDVSRLAVSGQSCGGLEAVSSRVAP
jgi:hypothetical protein